MKEGYAVLGLGRFGKTIAVTLAEAGFQVMAVDVREEAVQEVAEFVTYAVRGDVTDPDMVRSLGLGNMEGVFVAIANNLEASVMATLLAKESGAVYVVAKGDSELHATILKKMGADKVVIPEQDMGINVARNMILGQFTDLIELSEDVSLIEMEMPGAWIGKNLIELDLRNKYSVNVVAVKSSDKTDVTPDPTIPMEKNQTILISGRNEDIRKLSLIK